MVRARTCMPMGSVQTKLAASALQLNVFLKRERAEGILEQILEIHYGSSGASLVYSNHEPVYD